MKSNLKKEDFYNTKVNVSTWDKESKSELQELAFRLGFKWGLYPEFGVKHLDAYGYSFDREYILYTANENEHSGATKKEITYSDIFPPQQPFNEFSQNAKCMTETDPNGISQHEAGAKLDSGKPMAGRLLAMFGNALYAVSEVGTFGANKYTEGGWQHVQDGFKRYDDAGMRHFLKRGMGEEVDPDSNLPHLAHEAWNAMAKLELYLRDKAK